MAESVHIPVNAGEGLPVPAINPATSPTAPVAGGPVGSPQDPTGGQTQTQQYAGKYNSVSELESAYTELQAKFTQTAQQVAANVPPPVAAPAPAAAAAWDLAPYYAEYAQNSVLSEVSMQNLVQTTGAPREVIEQYMRGAQATAQQTLGEGHALMGGADKYQAVIDWTAQNAPQDAAVVNGYLQQGKVADWKMGLESLQGRYNKAMGTDPTNSISGQGGFGSVPTGTKGYNTHQEMVKAMGAVDAQGQRRYDKDPEYRNSVTERVRVSKFDGIKLQSERTF